MSTNRTILLADARAPDDPASGEHIPVLRQMTRELQVQGHQFSIKFSGPRMDGPLSELIADADYLIVIEEPISRPLLSRAEHLKLIHKLGWRLEKIDLEAARRQSIPVAVTSHYGHVSVAEHAFMLMLALGKRLLPLHRKVQEGYNPRGLPRIETTQKRRYFNWPGFPPDYFTPLYGRTLGIIGLGEIGMEMVRRARAFGMEVLYIKRRRLERSEEEKLEVQFTDLPELLRNSDFVSVHCTYNDETHHLLDRKAFELMKPTAFLINTARGNIVDQVALAQALREKLIAGAGLDVYGVEPPLPDDPLLHMEEVVLSPHIAARSSIHRRYQEAFANIQRVASGLEPKHLVHEVMGS
jgi:phosphoglycerate dehydrogenase-like enzyme